MRRLIAAGVLLTFVLTSIFVGNYFIRKNCNHMNNMVTDLTIKVEEGKYTDSVKYAEKTEEYWQTAEKVLTAISNHDNVDEISVRISSANSYIKSKNKTMAISKLLEIKKLLEMILEEQTFNIESFF